MQTLYTTLSNDVVDKLSDIKLIAFDVDGIFSDGRIYLGNQGEELKAFHTRDGYGVKSLQTIGIEVAIITGRASALVQDRMSALGVQYIVQGCEDKAKALGDLKQTLGLQTHNVASMGDDMPDVGMFAESGLCISVADGHPLVKQHCQWVTVAKGGQGAVREVTDTLLQVHGQLNDIHSASI